MKQKKLFDKKVKKPNIPFRRKVAIIYARIKLITKIFIFIFLYLLFFTQYLNFIKHEIAQNIYELTADMGFKLENVLIEGQQNALSEDILATLNADTGTPIFALNLPEIQKQLQKISWIKAAAIERRLPSTLYIALLERTPIAIWQINKQFYLVDEEGYKITDSNLEKFADLLHVVGSDANIYANKLIKDFVKYPELAAKILSAVRYGERRWNLNFQQDITVKMPEAGFDKALNYLSELNKACKLFDQGYKSIDLRDHDKYYIEKF